MKIRTRPAMATRGKWVAECFMEEYDGAYWARVSDGLGFYRLFDSKEDASLAAQAKLLRVERDKLAYEVRQKLWQEEEVWI